MIIKEPIPSCTAPFTIGGSLTSSPGDKIMNPSNVEAKEGSSSNANAESDERSQRAMKIRSLREIYNSHSFALFVIDMMSSVKCNAR